MRVTLILCDSCEAADGKLFMLGGGWSITGPGPITMGLAIKIDVPWDQANEKHQLKIALVSADGEPVQVEGPFGQQPVEIVGEFEVGRPAGLRPGTPIDYVLAINMGALQVPPDGRYEWRMSIDGHEDEDWRVSFSTRPVFPSAEGGLPPSDTN